MAVSSHEIMGQLAASQAYSVQAGTYSAGAGSPYGAATPMPPPPPAYTPFTYSPQSHFADAYKMSSMMTAGVSRAPMTAWDVGTGAGMLGTVMGSRTLGMLDPYTTAARAGSVGFRAATGGMGFGAAAEAGMGTVGRGLMGFAAGAALPAMGAYGIYKGLQTYGGAMYGGAQEASQFSGMADQAFSFTNPQSFTGKGFSSQDKQRIHSSIRTIADIPELLTSVSELQDVFGKLAESEMFLGVRNAEEVTSKFKASITALRKISTMMGTTLSGALPYFQEARSAGFLSPQEITFGMENMAITQGMAGMSTGAITQTRLMGGQIAHQLGGSRVVGGIGAERRLRMTEASLASGTLSEEQMYEITGRTGQAGRMAMTGEMLGIGARFSQTAAGRLTAAAAAQTEGGEFTGKLDPTILEAIRRGEYSTGDMRSMASKNIAAGGGRAAFSDVQASLTSEMAAQGPETIAGFVKNIMEKGDRYGKDTDMVVRRVMQHLGVKDRNMQRYLVDMVENYDRNKREEIGKAEQELSRMGTSGMVRERGLTARWERAKRSAANVLGISAAKRFGADISFGMEQFSENFMDELTGIERSTVSGAGADLMGRAIGGDEEALAKIEEAQTRELSGLREEEIGDSAMANMYSIGGVETAKRSQWVKSTALGRRQREWLSNLGLTVSGGQVYSGMGAKALGEASIPGLLSISKGLKKSIAGDKLSADPRFGLDMKDLEVALRDANLFGPEGMSRDKYKNMSSTERLSALRDDPKVKKALSKIGKRLQYEAPGKTDTHALLEAMENSGVSESFGGMENYLTAPEETIEGTPEELRSKFRDQTRSLEKRFGLTTGELSGFLQEEGRRSDFLTDFMKHKEIQELVMGGSSEALGEMLMDYGMKPGALTGSTDMLAQMARGGQISPGLMTDLEGAGKTLLSKDWAAARRQMTGKAESIQMWLRGRGKDIDPQMQDYLRTMQEEYRGGDLPGLGQGMGDIMSYMGGLSAKDRSQLIGRMSAAGGGVASVGAAADVHGRIMRMAGGGISDKEAGALRGAGIGDELMELIRGGSKEALSAAASDISARELIKKGTTVQATAMADFAENMEKANRALGNMLDNWGNVTGGKEFKLIKTPNVAGEPNMSTEEGPG